MTVRLRANFGDIGLGTVDGVVKFSARRVRAAADGTTTLVGHIVRARITGGVMEQPLLDGGVMRVWVEIDDRPVDGPYDIDAPTTGTADLLPLILIARVDPATGPSVLREAIEAYFRDVPSAGLPEYLSPTALAAQFAGHGFSYVQATPAGAWSIMHNLGRYPAAVTVLVGSELVDADVHHPSVNQTVVTFAIPASGRVELL